MALGHNDMQAADLFDAVAEMNVGAAAGHVGGDGNASALAGLRHDLGLVLILRGVEHGVRQPGFVQFLAGALRGDDRAGADQDRHVTDVQRGDTIDDQLPFGCLAPQHDVGPVNPPHRLASGDISVTADNTATVNATTSNETTSSFTAFKGTNVLAVAATLGQNLVNGVSQAYIDNTGKTAADPVTSTAGKISITADNTTSLVADNTVLASATAVNDFGLSFATNFIQQLLNSYQYTNFSGLQTLLPSDPTAQFSFGTGPQTLTTGALVGLTNNSETQVYQYLGSPGSVDLTADTPTSQPSQWQLVDTGNLVLPVAELTFGGTTATNTQQLTNGALVQGSPQLYKYTGNPNVVDLSTDNPQSDPNNWTLVTSGVAQYDFGGTTVDNSHLLATGTVVQQAPQIYRYIGGSANTATSVDLSQSNPTSQPGQWEHLGTAGDIYEYVGPAGQVDLGATDYGNSSLWTDETRRPVQRQRGAQRSWQSELHQDQRGCNRRFDRHQRRARRRPSRRQQRDAHEPGQSFDYRHTRRINDGRQQQRRHFDGFKPVRWRQVACRQCGDLAKQRSANHVGFRDRFVADVGRRLGLGRRHLHCRHRRRYGGDNGIQRHVGWCGSRVQHHRHRRQLRHRYGRRLGRHDLGGRNVRRRQFDRRLHLRQFGLGRHRHFGGGDQFDANQRHCRRFRSPTSASPASASA